MVPRRLATVFGVLLTTAASLHLARGQDDSPKPTTAESKTQVRTQTSVAYVRQGKANLNTVCSRCHGKDGKGAKGPNLTTGYFRHAETDKELLEIMTDGISGTGMPGFGEHEDIFLPIIAYLRDEAKRTAQAAKQVPQGDLARGKALFDKHKCASCHWTGKEGGRRGSDLSRLSATADYIRKSLLEPDAQISREYQFVVIALETGQVLQGRRLYENAHFLLLMDEQENFKTIPKVLIERITRPKKSLMPSFKEHLNSQETDDLIAYISSFQKGRSK